MSLPPYEKLTRRERRSHEEPELVRRASEARHPFDHAGKVLQRALICRFDRSKVDFVAGDTSGDIDLEVRFAKGSDVKLRIHPVRDQGPPLPVPEGVREESDEWAAPPDYSIDPLALLDAETLRSSLIGWARTVPPQNVGTITCARSLLPEVIAFLDPDNTGKRPIEIRAD